MLNSCNLVGTIVKMPYVLKDSKDFEHLMFDLEVERPFRNSEGEYEADVFPVEIWDGEADYLMETSEPGDYISVRGRLSTLHCNNGDQKITQVIVTGESFGYLTKRIRSLKKKNASE